MEKILFDVNVLKIQINKHGDTIDIDLRDRSQVNSVLKVFDEFMSKYQVLVNSNSEENNWDNIEQMASWVENSICDLFGKEIIQKIFGVEHPSIQLLSKFLVELSVIIISNTKKYEDDFIKDIEGKYSLKYFNRLNQRQTRAKL